MDKFYFIRRTERFGAVTGSLFSDTKTVSLQGAFLVLNPRIRTGRLRRMFKHCYAKGRNSHYAEHDLSTPRPP